MMKNLNLRARLVATVIIASIACAFLAAVLIGAVVLHQQRKFEIQRMNEAYAVAMRDLSLGDSVSLREGRPLLASNATAAVDRLCTSTQVGVALVPSYATVNPTATKSIFSGDVPSLSQSQNSTQFGVGPQNAVDIARLAASPQTVPLCGRALSESRVVYLEPLSGTGQSSVDLLLVGASPSWVKLVKEAGLGTLALFIGVLGIAAVAVRFALKHLRSATLGYSPVQLAAILEEQEAMLQGISEGVAGIDPSGTIRFFNSEAKRILKLPNHSVGRPLRVLVRGARLRQAVSGEISGTDLPVVVGDSVVIVNRIQVTRGDQELGYVVTLRDQTEWEGLLKELDSLVGMTSALRAQAHEFSNKIHTIVGLIEIGRPDEAVAFATEISLAHASVSHRLRESVGDPMISAMLLAKTAAASERAVDLIIEEDSSVKGRLISPAEILSVLGNLIDNAVDAASSEILQLGWKTSDRGWIKVLVRNHEDTLFIDLSDSGPGIPNDILPDIFTDGFSTKESRYGARRGLGLALVKQVITHSGGSISVDNVPGARFEISLPGAVIPNEITLPARRKALSTSIDPRK